MVDYKHKQIEIKWQKIWEEKKLFEAKDFSRLPKSYILIEFPYPSGEGLHAGHCRSYTALDILSRKRRMQGYNILYPIGWDAFGLPAENYAIKTGIHPTITTKENTDNYRRQLKSLGMSFDWTREINTTDPKYYKWTQWIFLKLYKKGLAYKAKMPINFCPSCKIGLANEEVVNGKCERCGAEVTQKVMEQWMLKITEYADRLIDDLDKVDYLPKIKKQQINWIGRSKGLEEDWQVEGMDLKLKTFTTWPHTSWGSTFMVIAPEHPIIQKLIKGTKYEKKVKEFCKKLIQAKIDDPLNTEKKKDGLFIGRYVINHLNRRKMPLYVANFAIYGYGTGIVKCTPAHDQRDFEFAKKYKLDIIPIISPKKDKKFDPQNLKCAYTGEGFMINAEQFNGIPTEKARKAIAEFTIKNGDGRWKTNYKLRDWIFSRQHYWGEPIPIIYCKKCGEVPVPEGDLPVKLPMVEKYEPTATGESPLANISNWVNTKCPKCEGEAKRETDTMPNWAGSSWYFLRYCDPHNDKALADKKKMDYWMPVDVYNGGMEHTTLHLLYSRFWYKFLYDIGVVPTDEPYKKRTSHGVVLGEGGVKMSKSRGNVVNPDDIVNKYGADTMRVYEMFMGPFEDRIAWDAKGVLGVYRFLNKVWRYFQSDNKRDLSDCLNVKYNQMIKKVSEDTENFDFNTAVSTMMEFLNMAQKEKIAPKKIEKFLIILSPFAPHLCEELWQKLGHKKSIMEQEWPKYDKKTIKEKKVTIVVQVNGKVRGQIETERGLKPRQVIKLARQCDNVKKYLKNQKLEDKKFHIINIPDRLINFVVKD